MLLLNGSLRKSEWLNTDSTRISSTKHSKELKKWRASMNGSSDWLSWSINVSNFWVLRRQSLVSSRRFKTISSRSMSYGRSLPDSILLSLNGWRAISSRLKLVMLRTRLKSGSLSLKNFKKLTWSLTTRRLSKKACLCTCSMSFITLGCTCPWLRLFVQKAFHFVIGAK